eukprot:Skav202607  [mRNA]  locus=scaffold2348:155830:163106:+ [translate_table: standard]
MVRAQDSAIEYLLALQARPWNITAWLNLLVPSSEGSDSHESIEADSAYSSGVVREAHLKQGPATPRSQAVGTQPVIKACLSRSQVAVATPALSAAGSSRSLPQALEVASPCSTRSAPVLAEARSVAALPAMRWSSAATTLTGSRRVQVKVASTTPVSTPRSGQSRPQVLTPRSKSIASYSHQPPLPVDGHQDALQRSRSWQPTPPAALPVLLPMRYTVGSAALKRPPMAQVVS